MSDITVFKSEFVSSVSSEIEKQLETNGPGTVSKGSLCNALGLDESVYGVVIGILLASDLDQYESRGRIGIVPVGYKTNKEQKAEEKAAKAAEKATKEATAKAEKAEKRRAYVARLKESAAKAQAEAEKAARRAEEVRQGLSIPPAESVVEATA